MDATPMAAKRTIPTILIGQTGGDHVSIGVAGRMHPAASDYWDGNWLLTPIEVSAGSCRASVGASLRAEELRRFRTELEKLSATLSGEATLTSMEGWIDLKVAIDRVGHLRVAGLVVDRPGGPNRLNFKMTGLDQTFLASIVAALLEAEEAFPVVGTP